MGNGWMRWVSGGLLVVALLVLGRVLDAAPSARFPGDLFTYCDPAGRKVQLFDFAALGREVEAMQRVLGKNLTNLPRGQGQFYAEATTSQPFVVSEPHTAVWSAPGAITLTKISCEVTGGTSIMADLAIRRGSASPVSVNGANLLCPPGGATYTNLGGQTAMNEGDRIDVNIGGVTGTPASFRITWQYGIAGL